MGILDTYKAETKRDQENAPYKGAPEGQTLQQILKNEKSNGLFGKMLANEGSAQARKLSARLMEGKITQADISELEAYRAEFSERMEKAKFLKENITAESVQKFASRSPEFQEIINLVGPKAAATVIAKRLETMSVDDLGRFEGIHKAMQTLVNKEESYTALNETVTKMTSQYGVSEQTYVKALQSNTEEGGVKAIRKDIRSKLSLFGKAKDSVKSWFSSGTSSKARAHELMGKKAEIEKAINQVNTNIKNVGAVLSESVNESEDIRATFASELINEKKQEEKIPTMDEAREKDTFPKTADDLNAIWSDITAQPGFDQLTEQEQEDEYDRMIKTQKATFEKNNPSLGFWGTVVQTIFELMAKSEKKKLFPKNKKTSNPFSVAHSQAA